LGSPIRPISFGFLGFVSLRRVLNLLKLTEFDRIDDPKEVEQDVLEEIDLNLVSYTFSTRGGDQHIYLNKVYQFKKKLQLLLVLFEFNGVINTPEMITVRALLIYCKTVKRCKTFTIDVLHFRKNHILNLYFLLLYVLFLFYTRKL